MSLPYFCHACGRIISPAGTLVCPNCDSEFIEIYQSSIHSLDSLINEFQDLAREIITDSNYSSTQEDANSTEEVTQSDERRPQTGVFDLRRYRANLELNLRRPDTIEEHQRAFRRNRERDWPPYAHNRNLIANIFRDLEESLSSLGGSNLSTGFESVLRDFLNTRNSSIASDRRNYATVREYESIVQLLLNQENPQYRPVKKEFIENLEIHTDIEIERCTVCMNAVEIGEESVVFDCTHAFHRTCALGWFSVQNTCPNCRRKFEAED